MATLNSPGVSVTVVDESFYTPAAAGTVPLFVVASAQNKANGAGTGTAPGTTAANAGKVYLLTSQKDVSDTFGIPKFYTDAENNPIHAGEQNEYGLEAAYSFLGVSNRAYVVRADVDLASLSGSTNTPTSPPPDGTIWLDTVGTKYGIFEWNSAAATTTGGQTFTNQSVTVITDTSKLSNWNGSTLTYTTINPSVGAIGDYAIVAVTTLQKLFFKKYLSASAAGVWVEVGTSAWAASWPTATGTTPNSSITLLSGDTLVINGNTITGQTTLTGLITAINAANITGVTAGNINGYLNLFSTGVSIVLSGTSVAKVGLSSTTYLAPSLVIAPHYQVPTFKRTDNTSSANGYPTGSIWVKTTQPNLGADWVVKKYNATTSAWVEQKVSVSANGQSALAVLDPTGGGANLATGSIYVKYNDGEVAPALSNFKLYIRTGAGAASIVSVPVQASTFVSGANAFTVQESVIGSTSLTASTTVSFTATGNATADAQAFLTAFTAALPNSNLVATLNSDNTITISHIAGGDFRLVDTTPNATTGPVGKLFTPGITTNFYSSPTGTNGSYVASLWSSVAPGTQLGFANVSNSAPTSTAADGTIWYDTNITGAIDIMVNNGTTWVGYLNFTQNQAGGSTTDPAGPIVSATQPTVQSDGTALANGDLWIDTADIENFPVIYKYNFTTKLWVLVDKTDQVSENGVLFADARWNTNGTVDTPSTIINLLSSDFLDPDAPDPALFPKGMLLWNLRRSGFNVKKYVKNHINTSNRNPRHSNELMSSYFPDRWVSYAANQADGSGSFGRKAVREVVVTALNATINSNQEIRDNESRVFNLISCPGYIETTPALKSLNYDRGLTAFIVADTPARLKPDATTLGNWAQNVNSAVTDSEEGLVTTDAYIGIYYPWGYSTDLLGNNIVVPPSHMMLRTIALNDNVSYPWFAPAGVRRGGITNASSVGYVDGQTGEFNAVALNTGQRDTLQLNNVNPITYLTGVGLVAYGQKTRQLVASSLDRINVARLVVYLRRQLDRLAKPYVFEPNDTITRNEIKQAAESLMLELVGQRAIYDYLVVCDTSNNTPARIDRNELHLDIAIEPVKAVEFIYIPLRLENTGAIKGLGGK
jgi:hypothetical protein